MFALPIFPGSRPPSIVGVHVLNFCVRDGNRWTLIAINTNSSGWLKPSPILKAFQLLIACIISLTRFHVKQFLW